MTDMTWQAYLEIGLWLFALVSLWVTAWCAHRELHSPYHFAGFVTTLATLIGALFAAFYRSF